jgi:putative FmdB family regulatory protein
MPLYEYECGRCAHKFELRRSFSEGASANCPQCNGVAQRIFAPVPIVFKGSGFYVTDYRKEKSPPEEKTEAKTECKTGCQPGKTGGGDTSTCKN